MLPSSNHTLMKQGEFIKIEYEARIINTGMLFDTTKIELAAKTGISGAEGPETILVGENYVLKGLDEELEKHTVGDEFTITLTPEKAFGKRRGEMIRTFSLQMFKKEKINPVPGLVLNLAGMNGKILSVSGGRVRMDFNHPLAGKAVQYKTKILEKVTDEKEKLKAIIKARMRITPEITKQKEKIIITTEKEMPKQAIEILKPEIEKHVKTKLEFKTKPAKKEK